MEQKYITAKIAKEKAGDLELIRKNYASMFSKLDGRIEEAICLNLGFIRRPVPPKLMTIVKLHFTDIGYKVIETEEIYKFYGLPGTYYWVYIVWDEEKYQSHLEEKSCV